MIKRILSIIVALTMILSLFGSMQINVFAATEYTYGNYTYTVSSG